MNTKRVFWYITASLAFLACLVVALMVTAFFLMIGAARLLAHSIERLLFRLDDAIFWAIFYLLEMMAQAWDFLFSPRPHTRGHNG